MSETDATRTSILDAAELRVRRYGYNGFSFRDLAGDVGISSASVHYHFKTKEDLCAAVAKRYADKFFTAVNDGSQTGHEWLARFVGVYRRALTEEKMICLCGMLGAELSCLPVTVADAAREFFTRSRESLVQHYLAVGLTPEKADKKATYVLAAMQGGLVMARTLGDVNSFDTLAEDILSDH